MSALPQRSNAMRVCGVSSGTIAGVFPSLPPNGDRNNWDDDLSREIARASPRAASGVYGAVPDGAEPHRSDRPAGLESLDEEEPEQEIETVPVRRQLSLAIAGFAVLLAVGLILGAQTSGPDARTPYAIVILGVQLLYVLAWTTAMRPPVPALVAGIAIIAAGLSDYLAVNTDAPRVLPFLYVALLGIVIVVIGQLAMRVDRLRVRDALGSALLIVFGVTAFASLIALTRKPVGTQAVIVCLTAAGVALAVARLADAVFPRPRIAPQVPRGGSGIVLGAMVGTLVAAGLGGVLVLPFTPARGAILGLVAASVAVLVDLAVNFTEAGRRLVEQAPTFWLARHMQGPLGAFALAAPVAYLLTSVLLT